MRFAHKLCVMTAATFRILAFPAEAQVNSWTNPVSGHWEDPSWSLGLLPGPSQSVFVTNAGYKAVGIFPATSTNFPGSLTVSNLQVSAPNNALSTLLLNFFGTTVPLHVLGDCEVGTNGTVLNLHAGFEVDGASGGVFRILGGSYGQESGILRASNVTTYAAAGTINLTNASAVFGDVYLGANVAPATMTQSGGSVAGSIYISLGSSYQLLNGTITGTTVAGYTSAGQISQYGGTNNGTIAVGTSDPFLGDGNGLYSLYGGGILNSSISVAGSSGFPVGVFNQIGGYINTTSLALGSSGFSTATFNQSNGVLVAGSLILDNAQFNQFGGQTTIGAPLTVAGTYDDYNPMLRTHAFFSMSGGVLNTPGLSTDMFGGFGQSGGTNNVSGNLGVNRSGYALGGGFLGTSNTSIAAGVLVLSDGTFVLRGTFSQSGGVHSIANTLTIQDTYSIGGGSLLASNILLNGTLNISNNPVITNPGAFAMGGTLAFSSSSQSFGLLLLSANAVLDFGLGNSSAHFKPSGAVSWTLGTLLVVSNWHGNPNGGGSSQLFVGSSTSGLSATQLSQVQFVNPAGFSPGKYAAHILSTGEIVPVTATMLGVTLSRPQLVLNWPGGLVLQSATNVSGPFSDLSASSPFTNPVPAPPRMFFRLRH